MNQHEEWRPVPGFPDFQVSDLGRVMSLKGSQPRLLDPEITRHGYRRITLTSTPRVRRKLHQLVLLAFVGPQAEGAVVRHLDGNSLNNALTNLRYGTPAENNYDAVNHGRHAMASKTHCKRGHEFTPESTYFNPRLKRRQCRPCKRATAALRAEGQVAA